MSLSSRCDWLISVSFSRQRYIPFYISAGYDRAFHLLLLLSLCRALCPEEVHCSVGGLLPIRALDYRRQAQNLLWRLRSNVVFEDDEAIRRDESVSRGTVCQTAWKACGVGENSLRAVWLPVRLRRPDEGRLALPSNTSTKLVHRVSTHTERAKLPTPCTKPAHT